MVVWSSRTQTLRTLAKFQLTDVSIDRVDRTAVSFPWCGFDRCVGRVAASTIAIRTYIKVKDIAFVYGDGFLLITMPGRSVTGVSCHPQTYLHEGYLFMVLGSSNSRLVSVVCIELATSRVMLPHVITQRGVVGALHLLKAGSNLYLVIGESHHYTPNDGKGRSE